jgi:hypothetical protein
MFKLTLLRDYLLTILVWLITAPSWAVAAQVDPYQAAVQRIVSGLESGHVESFVQAIDAEAIIDNATRGLFTDPSWLSGVRRGFTKEINKLLRLKTNEGGAQALLRFDYGDLGAGYMDFYLLRSERGDVRIVDWYDFGMGQRYTETLKQLIGMSAPTPTLLGTIFDITSKRKKTADIIQEIIDLKVQKKNKELVDKILQLDNTYRRSRVLCLSAVQSASQSDDIELYRRAMAKIQ